MSVASNTSNRQRGEDANSDDEDDEIDGLEENYSAGSFATVRTTEEQSRADILSFLTDPGSQ